MRHVIFGLLFAALISTAIIGTRPPALAVGTTDPSLSASALQGESNFSGRLTSTGGGSVQGVVITLDRAPADGEPEYETVTDLFGFYRFDDIDPGNYVVAISHPAFLGQEDTLALTPGERVNRNMSIAPAFDDPYFDITFNVLGVMS